MITGWLSLFIPEILARLIDFIISIFQPNKNLKESIIIISAKRIRQENKKKSLRNTVFNKKFEKIIYGWNNNYEQLNTREETLRTALKANKDIRIISEAGRGKTRTTIEVIRDLMISERSFKKSKMIFFPKDSNLENLRISKLLLNLTKKNYVLIFDEIDNITSRNKNLFSIIRDFKELRGNCKLICTCRIEMWSKRNEQWLNTRESIQAYFPTKIDIPKLEKEEGEQIANKLKIEFPKGFSGNAADILLRTPSKRIEYEKLSEEKKIVLRSIKFLKISILENITPSHLKYTSVVCFNLNESVWIESYTFLRNAEFFKEEEGRITIPDVYISKVIEEFPPYEDLTANIEELKIYLACLERYLVKNMFSNEIINLSTSYNSFGLFYQTLNLLGNLDKQIKETKGSDVYYLNLGIAQAKTSNLNNAIKNFTKAIERNNKSEITYYNRGHVYWQKGEINASINFKVSSRLYTKAIKDFTATLKLNKNNFQALYNRGICYQRKREFQRANNDFDNLIELYPNNSNYYGARGNTFFQQNEFKKSLKDLKKAIKIDETNSHAYYNIGSVYYSLKQYEKALTNLAKAIQYNPNYYIAYNYLGAIYATKENYKEAMEAFNKSLKINPRQIETLENRAILKEKIGNYSESIEDFVKALERDPHNVRVLLNMALVQARHGDFQASLNNLIKSVVNNIKDAKNIVNSIRKKIILLNPLIYGITSGFSEQNKSFSYIIFLMLFDAHQRTPKGIRNLNKLLKELRETYLKQKTSISLSKEEIVYWTDYIKGRLVEASITPELAKITEKQTKELINQLPPDQRASFMEDMKKIDEFFNLD